MKNLNDIKQNKDEHSREINEHNREINEYNREINEYNREIKERIQALAELEYQAFTSKLLPGVTNIIGVRLPSLRKIAKEIARGDWRTYLDYASEESFEEIMLQGMVIGYAKDSLYEISPYIANFVKKIDNWSVCDSFCSGLKITKDYKVEMWDFLNAYFHKQGEFEVRFGVVMLLNYYLDEEYIEPVCTIFDEIKHEGYYVKMAVAWTISMYYIHFPEEMEGYLRNNKLDQFTYRKALQKICESRAIDDKKKEQIKKMKELST